jgi:hypothetical protein
LLTYIGRDNTKATPKGGYFYELKISAKICNVPGISGLVRKGKFREILAPFVNGKKSDITDKLKTRLTVIMLVRETKVSGPDN